MAMVARTLGPVQNVVVRRAGLGDGALLLPASRTIASISSATSKGSAKQSRRSPSCRNTYAYSTSAGRGTAAVAMMQPLKGPPFALRASDSVGGNSTTRVRRNLHCNRSGFGDRAVAAGDWLHPPLATAAVRYQGDASRRGGMPSSGSAVKHLPSGGHGVVFLQAAGLRTLSRVSAPAGGEAAGKRPGGAAAPLSTPGSGSGHGNKTPPSPSEIRPPVGSGDRASDNMDPPAAAKPNDNPQAAEKSIGGDERTTVKGGNPDLRDREGGTFVEMRDRIRDARADASEDAKDWMRDKRDDMNTMKEV